MTPDQLLLGAILPGAVTTIALALIWRFQRRDPDASPRPPLWAAPVVFLVAYLCIDFAFLNRPRLWHADSTYRFFHAAIVLGVFGLIESSVAQRGPLRPALRALALAGALTLILEPIRRVDSPRDFALWLVAGTAVSFVFVTMLARASKRQPGWSSHALLALVPLAATLALLFGASAKFSNLASGLVAILAGAAVAGVVARKLTIAPGGALVVGGLLCTLLAAGTAFADAQWWSIGLILAAPGAMWITALKPLKTKPLLVRLAAQLVCIAIPLAIAVWIAFANKPQYDYFSRVARPSAVGGWACVLTTACPSRPHSCGVRACHPVLVTPSARSPAST